MQVAIIGAGGIGAYYGALLARSGLEVHLLARGANLAAIRSHGLIARTPDDEWTVRVHATDDADALSAVLRAGDLAVLAVKTYSLPDVAPLLARLADAGVDVLPLLNGVDAIGRLEALGVATARLLGGVTYVSAVRTAPGRVERRSPFQRVIVGEPGGGGPSARVIRVAQLFSDAGADAEPAADVNLASWQKFVFLASLSAACGLSRSPVGPLRAQPLGRRLLERAVHEVAAVGRAHGVALPPGEEARVLAQIDSLPAMMKPSFLLDVESGGATEVDALSGAVARLAEAAGVAVPVHDTAAVAFDAAGRASTVS